MTTVANLIIAQLLFLEAEDPERDISIYINSPGGSITAGLAILDTMAFVRPDIVTICVGQAASMAAVLLAAGTKGKRFSLPNSRIMIHQPSMQGLAGQAADIDIYAKEILRMREILNKILADASGQTVRARGPRCGSRLHHEPGSGRGLRDHRSRNLQPRTGAHPRFKASLRLVCVVQCCVQSSAVCCPVLVGQAILSPAFRAPYLSLVPEKVPLTPATAISPEIAVPAASSAPV